MKLISTLILALALSTVTVHGGSHCSNRQHPVDGELGIAGLESSPGVRRMEAMVGSEICKTHPLRVMD
jgi:hypothetical protein